MKQPTYKMAFWVHAQITEAGYSADDVYDVLLGNITVPTDFVNEVKSLAIAYEEDKGRHDAR